MIPREIVYRKKQGFGAPVSEWFRGELGERAQEQIRGSSLAERGLLDYDRVDELWASPPLGRAGVGLPALEPLQRQRLARLLGRRALARLARMGVGLRAGFAAWRRLGPIEGTRAAMRLGAERARQPLRRARIRVRPPRVTPAEVRTRTGRPRHGRRSARARAGVPCPRWRAGKPSSRPSVRLTGRTCCAERTMLSSTASTCSGPVRSSSVRRSTGSRTSRAAGAGRVSTSRRCRSRIRDGSDIKVPWELSRCQHLPLLAAAHRLTGDPSYLDELGAQVDHWIAAEPRGDGANWACTMDVAIRAANWVAALAMCAESAVDAPWLDTRTRQPAATRPLRPLAS